MSIDLEVQINPNPAIKQAYVNANCEKDYYPFWEERSEYVNESRIFLYAKASKQPIKHKITSIYRKKEQGREVVFFYEHLSTRDLFNNFVDHTRTVGRYELPHIEIDMGMDPNVDYDPMHPKQLGPSARGTEISSTEEIYQYDWKDLRPWLIEQEKKGLIDSNTQLTVWVGTRRYTVEDLYNFLNLDFDSLVLLGRTGFQASGIFNKEELLAFAREKGKAEILKTLKTG